VTGTKLQSDVKGDAQQLVKRIRRISKLPVLLVSGFPVQKTSVQLEITRMLR